MSDTSAELLYLAHFAHTQRVHQIACTAFLFWDLSTTLDEEVEYVWGSANTFPKYLYFISRYLGLLGQFVLSTNVVPIFCFDYLMISFGFLLMLILSVELSLMLRIDALYGNSRRVRFLLGFAFLVEMAFSLWLNMASIPYITHHLAEFPPAVLVRGCLLDRTDVMYVLAWVPITVFETILFVLNAIKCISYSPLDNAPLIYRLFRDSSLYFAIVLLFTLFVTIGEVLWPAAATPVVVWMPAVFSYSGSHLLLSIRKIAARRQRLEMTYTVSVGIPHIQAGFSTSDSSSLGDDTPSLPPRVSSASRVRPSVQVNVEAIELVPRRTSLVLTSYSEESQEGTSALSYTRDWDVVFPDSVREIHVERSRSRGCVSDDPDSGGLPWLQRWNP
ncbi:hypothetical protein BD311DRAFT_768988 [Dichomitus squalens]|uniref:DUF6533 domain-containing protein n=1 Tax=Dichomitus squalens TaxID=114155 RepID=A0A4Q9MB65_9APHY|nr:hypothetical protein BD311DRAFT_768988 [Dichomitus squalens]